MKLLTIAIPTLKERKQSFDRLMSVLEADMNEDVEIIFDDTDRHQSIGRKRSNLYKRASGLFTVQIDDDDLVVNDYITTFCDSIESCHMMMKNIDCICYYEKVHIKNQERLSKISLEYCDWESFKRPVNNIWYVRTPFFKTPIRTDVCVETDVKDMRYAEDKDFADRIYSKLRNQIFIDEVMYLYFAPEAMTQAEINKRYGIQST